MSNYKSSVLYRLNHIPLMVQMFIGMCTGTPKLTQLKERKGKERNNNTICETSAEFFLAGREVQWTKVAKEYWWAMTKVVGQPCCSLSGSAC